MPNAMVVRSLADLPQLLHLEELPPGPEELPEQEAASVGAPDLRDFPGLPIRTRMTTTKHSQPAKPGGAALGGATEITTTIISANQNPISDAEFTAPNDFKETKLPDIFDKKNAAPSTSPNP